jgi:hypothetical protein
MSGESFEAVSAVEVLEPGRYGVTVPDGWQQGRGAFGGLVLGTLLRAMEKSEPDTARTTRTLAGDLCGPVMPGPAEVRVMVLRRGSNLTNLRADLLQGGAVQATATAVLATARKGAVKRISPPAPGRPAFEQCEVIPVEPPMGPVFAQHYEYRLVSGVPYSGAAEAQTSGYIREKVPLARLDGPAVMGRLDAWWPALFPTEEGPRAMATVSFTAEVVADLSTIDPAAAFFHTARVHHLREGYSLELRELWLGETLVALNQQTFAVLG